MKKRFVNLDKKWKEIIFAASGFGPNLLMVLMGAYFTDAMNPTALPAGSLQAISGVCLITPALFSVLWFIGKVFDGLVDVPLAQVTDNLKTKWGRRRVPIAVSFIPMVLSYVLCWIPISETNMVANTIWIFVWSMIFFSSYTMSLISFYGSLSTVCANENQRLRVSSYKSFFDTISYCLVYALVPVMLKVLNVHIDTFTFMLVPLMLTMLIPLFIIKEGDKWEAKALKEGYDITPLAEEPKVTFAESIKLTVKNKVFMTWCLVNCCSYFGLQMFLVAMNALIVGGMELSEVQMAILNTCAFAPVPLMLYLFNKLRSKKGIRFAYQTCLISFAICILSFVVGNSYFAGDNTMFKMIVGCIGGVVGSWAIGSFFMMGYMIPSQISSVEEKLTKKNHSAMYFAVQALTTTVVGAIASSLVYENIKMLFINKSTHAITYAIAGEKYASAREAAAHIFNTDITNVFNFGTLIVPVIVSVFCIIGFFVAFKMPKDYTPEEIAKRLGLMKEYKKNKDLFNEEKKDSYDDKSLLMVIPLWLLTGSLFGIFWRFDLLTDANRLNKKKISVIHFIISILVFPYAAYLIYNISKTLNKELDKQKLKHHDLTILYTILTVLGLEIVALIGLQLSVNKLARKENNK